MVGSGPHLTRMMLVVIAVAASSATGQSGGDFRISRSVVAGGSGTAAAGDFGSDQTLGQADAGRLSGGAFVVKGGFWAEQTEALPPLIFADGFED